MGNKVTWFEVNGPEAESTAKFYAELFGWHVESVPDMNYHLFDTHSGSGINGAVSQAREGQRGGSVFYVENPDIQALLDKAESMGGKTLVPVTVIPDMATFAQFMDPFGNAMGLVQGDGSVRISEGSNPPVDWFEYGCAEPEKAWDFYRALFGWKIEGSKGEGYVHGQVDAGGGIHGGIGSSPTGQPHVTMYASVDDLAKYLERAESLGGKTVMQPMKVDEHTTIAVFLDPQGTMFGIYASTD